MGGWYGQGLMTDIIRSSRLDLILLSTHLIDAMISGDRDGAQRDGGFLLPDVFPDEPVCTGNIVTRVEPQ
jgi:hypothetical protein